MNVNVIKQFSVYLKLQTSPSIRPSPGVGIAKKNCFSFSSTSQGNNDNYGDETMPRKLFFPLLKILLLLLRTLYMSIFLISVLNLYFSCCLSFTAPKEEKKASLGWNRNMAQAEKNRESKKCSHNRRNMNKRFLNTNECLKTHKKRKNDIFSNIKNEPRAKSESESL